MLQQLNSSCSSRFIPAPHLVLIIGPLPAPPSVLAGPVPVVTFIVVVIVLVKVGGAVVSQGRLALQVGAWWAWWAWWARTMERQLVGCGCCSSAFAAHV